MKIILAAFLVSTFGIDLRAAEPSPSASGFPSDCESCRIVLLPHAGSDEIDRLIQKYQLRISKASDLSADLEAIGWLFVRKSRVSNDPGFYKLAEQAALCLDRIKPGAPEGMLLRGHVLHSLHRFKAAEPLARTLIEKRGAPFDYGLLGDVVMEQGRLDEAVTAYQQMIDLRPDLHSYSRAAHLRWLKGDVEGAIELAALAVTAASPRDPESAAWINTRLASYQFQAGNIPAAQRALQTALQYQPNYAAALLLRGRMELAENNLPKAIDSLERATQLNPLPEPQWLLADALLLAGRIEDAKSVEKTLERSGAVNDPRSFALYLATRGRDSVRAAQLAQRELQDRADVFTHDAIAWALHCAGRSDEALAAMQRALSEGTRDARLSFHAAAIYHAAGRSVEAKRHVDEANALKHLLYPSERNQLNQLIQRYTKFLGGNSPVLADGNNKTTINP